MTLTQIEYVLAVEKFKHFKKAAESCFITQPTLSMQIQKLEDELGIIIFDRSKSPVILTLEGERFVVQARSVIREYKKLIEVSKFDDSDIKGDFHLAVIPTLSPYIIPIFLDKFQQKFKNINLKIEEMKTKAIIASLENDQLDGALLVTPLNESSLIEKVLYYENFKIFFNPEHQLLKKKKIKEKDLDPSEVWLLNEGHCFRSQVLKVCHLKQNKRQNSFESGNLETLKNMVLKTSGYTILPEMATSDLSVNQSKLIRDFSKPVPTREVSIVYSRAFQKERIINAIEETILGNLPKDLKSLKNKEHQIIEIE